MAAGWNSIGYDVQNRKLWGGDVPFPEETFWAFWLWYDFVFNHVCTYGVCRNPTVEYYVAGWSDFITHFNASGI